VILDNLVKISENVDQGRSQQPPAGEQQQVLQKQHRSFSFKNFIHRKGR
jgi:hypothetical protein